MSDRLAISATLSVLIMSAWVLLGGEATTVPFGPQALSPPTKVEAPSLLPDLGRLLPLAR